MERGAGRAGAAMTGRRCRKSRPGSGEAGTGSGGGEAGGQAVRLVALGEAVFECRARLGDALAAAGAEPCLTAQFTHAADATVNSGADMAV
jgi:hypothetical protein